MADATTYRTVRDCDEIRKERDCEQHRTERWLIGLVTTLLLSLLLVSVGWGLQVASVNARQDAQIMGIEKNQARIMDKLEQIETLIRNGGR